MRWKKEGMRHNSFHPLILDNKLIKNFASQNKNRLVISACDIDYLEKNIKCLFAYKASDTSIPDLVLLFLEEPSKESDIRLKIKKIKSKLACNKIEFALFSCDELLGVKEDLGIAAYKDYMINYIRCARFIMVQSIWNILEINTHERRIVEASTYVIDFDNFVKGDLNREAKIEYGDKQAIFCWDKSVSPKSNFPNSLSSFSNSSDSIRLNFNYKVVKAGLVVLSPCKLTKLILNLFEFYSIGPSHGSSTDHKLFCFYYGDQIAILNSLREIKENDRFNYNNNIGWIDTSTSAIANLKKSNSPTIWMPKGTQADKD